MGGGREAPQLAKNWSSGRRTKVSERAPQLGGEAGPGGRPRLGCSRPPSCARDGAGRRGPPPLPRCRLRSTPIAPTKTRTPSTEGQGNNTRGRGPRPGPSSPGHPGAVVGVTTSHELGTARAQGCPRPPSGPAPSAGEDQSPQSRARRMLPPRGPCEHPRASTPGGHPERAPPDTLRRRAGAVISVLLGPRGTRKYVGEKFPLPHGGEDVGGERAEDGEQRWEDVSGPRCAHHPSPGGAG